MFVMHILNVIPIFYDSLPITHLQCMQIAEIYYFCIVRHVARAFFSMINFVQVLCNCSLIVALMDTPTGQIPPTKDDPLS